MPSANTPDTTYWVHFHFLWSRDAEKTDWEHLMYARECLHNGTAWRTLTSSGGPGFAGGVEPILCIQMVGPLEGSENWAERADTVLRHWSGDILRSRRMGVPWCRADLFAAQGSTLNHAVVRLHDDTCTYPSGSFIPACFID